MFTTSSTILSVLTNWDQLSERKTLRTMGNSRKIDGVHDEPHRPSPDWSLEAASPDRRHAVIKLSRGLC